MTSNEVEFEQIYTEFHPRIYRYLTQLVGAKEAEDLTQDVFINISLALTTFKQQSQLSTWIYRIATNTAIDKMRSRSSKHEDIEMNSLVETLLNKTSVHTSIRPRSIEEQVIRKDMNECIRECVATLPEKFRTVVTLSELEGLKNSEIAEILGLSLGAVKILLHRGKAKLKEVLLVNCNFYRTDCCNGLACEPKGAVIKKIKSSIDRKH